MQGKALKNHISQTGCGTREYAPVHIKNYESLGELHSSLSIKEEFLNCLHPLFLVLMKYCYTIL